jgi:hypothetical protein
MMKIILNLSALLFLLVAAPVQSSAEMVVKHVTKTVAKEMGMEVRVTPNGPAGNWIELEFETKGGLADFSHVTMELKEGEKLQVSTSIKETRPAAGRVVVGFSADRASLEKIRLVVVAGRLKDYTGYDLWVKDFAEADKVR